MSSGFLAACITSVRTDSTGSSRAVRNPPFCRILHFARSDIFLDSTLRSLLLSTKLSHLTRGQRDVAIYNVLGALAAVHEILVALANVLPPRPVAHLPYSLQRWQVLSRELAQSFGM